MEDQDREEPFLKPAKWVEMYGDSLYRYAVARVGAKDIAEDIVQDTLLAAYTSIKKFREESSESTWLFGILKHKVMDHYRKRSRTAQPVGTEALSETVNPLFDSRGRWKESPRAWEEDLSTFLTKKDFWRTVQQCLFKLPETHRHAFILHEMDHVPGKEICKVLGITPTNLWVILHRARMGMRGCLDRNWFGKQDTEEL